MAGENSIFPERNTMKNRPFADWVWSLSTVAVCSVAAQLLSPYFSTIDQAMLYFIGVVITASRTGTGPTIATVVLSIAAFDFFFVPPRFTFAVSDSRYVVTFAVMFMVSYVISRLTLRIRRQADESLVREHQTAALYRMSRELLSERDTARLQEIASMHIGTTFDAEVRFTLLDRQGQLVFPAGGERIDGPDEKERAAAQWALDLHQPAGAHILNGPDAEATYVPLLTSRGPVGVLGVTWRIAKDDLEPAVTRFLEAFADQAAIAVERAELVDEAHHALRKVEAERFRNTLLSSISHDLRTPLTSVSGAASTLLADDSAIDPHSRRELLQTISEEAGRLTGMIRNVLDLTRLESGAFSVKKEWQSLEEIVGVVLRRLGGQLIGRKVDVRLPVDLPLIPCDGLLLEQVLSNLIENAVKYTPEGAPVDLTASETGSVVTIEVADHGPGIPPGDEDRIFEKFVRGRTAGGGVGLGLAICRSIIIAHGGCIWVENREGGGAAFRFTLPAEGSPSLPGPEEETGAPS